jgi:hypothetical protein
VAFLALPAANEGPVESADTKIDRPDAADRDNRRLLLIADRGGHPLRIQLCRQVQAGSLKVEVA